MANKDLSDYMGLPYSLSFIAAPDGGVIVSVEELPGCRIQCATIEDGAVRIRRSMELWISLAIKEGRAVPEPPESEQYSGRFVVRIPKSVHRDVVLAAQHDGVSVDVFVVSALSRAVGRSVG